MLFILLTVRCLQNKVLTSKAKSIEEPIIVRPNLSIKQTLKQELRNGIDIDQYFKKKQKIKILNYQILSNHLTLYSRPTFEAIGGDVQIKFVQLQIPVQILNDIFKFEFMNVKDYRNCPSLTLWILNMMLIASVYCCDLIATCDRTVLVKTFQLDPMTISKTNYSWPADGKAKVTVDANNLTCLTDCSFIDSTKKSTQNNSLGGTCQTTRVDIQTYNISWSNINKNISNGDIRLSLFCSFPASENYFFKTYNYSLTYKDSSQNCSSYFNVTPANVTPANVTPASIPKHITFDRNIDEIGATALYQFNISTLTSTSSPFDLSLYTSQLFINITNFIAENTSVVVKYIFKNNTNSQKKMAVVVTGNQTTFALPQQFKSNVSYISFQLGYKNSEKFQPFNITLRLLYSLDKNYTIFQGYRNFTNAEHYEPIYNNSENATFNLTKDSIKNNTIIKVKLRQHQHIDFSFQISVDKTKCPINNRLCLNLFDYLSIQASTLLDNKTFQFVNQTSITINDQKIIPNKNWQSNSILTIPGSNFSQGLNRVSVTGLQWIDSVSNLALKCKQAINGVQYTIRQIYFSFSPQPIITNIAEIKLRIKDQKDIYASEFNQTQQLDLQIKLQSSLEKGDYAVIQVPPQYKVNGTSVVNQSGNGSHQIWVEGNFSNTTTLYVSIDKSVYRFPTNLSNISAFQVNTYFSYNVLKDVYNASIVKNDIFYFKCNNKTCSSCYKTNETISYYGYFSNDQCVICNGSCLQCLSATNCTVCQSKYSLFRQDGTCLSSCPSSYFSNNSICTKNPTNQSSSNSNNSTTINSNSTTVVSESKTSTLAIPCTISILLLILIAGGSKFIFPQTQLFSLFATFSGLIQVFSWCLSLWLILNYSQNQAQLSANGKSMLIGAISSNFVINLIGFYLLKADLFQDHTFYRHLYGLRSNQNMKFYLIGTAIAVAMLISNQFVEILFSNFFGLRCFSFKVQDVAQLRRHNYLRLLSLIPSGLSLTAGVFSLLSMTQKSMTNNTFLGLIDMCLITCFGIISTLKVSFRDKQDYQLQSRQQRIDINEQISNQPVSDIHQPIQPRNNKSISPNKSKSAGKAIILNGSKKKAKLVEEDNQTHQYIKPLNNQQIFCTEDHLQEKDFDQHSNNLNQTRVTAKVYVSRPKKNITEAIGLKGQETQTRITKIRSNRRGNSKPIKQHIEQNHEQSLKQQIQCSYSPDQVKILKSILSVNEIYSKLITEQHQSQANLNNQRKLTILDKMSLLVKFKTENQPSIDRQTQFLIQEIDLSVDLLAYKKIKVEMMIEYFQLKERQEREVQQQNRCSNQSTPYVDYKNEKVLSKGSRYNSKETRKKSKKRRSNFREGAKMFLEKDSDDISPYVADFYANHQIQAENCQLQREEVDEEGNIQAKHYLSIDHQPLTLMRGKGSNSLENTGGQEIYGQSKRYRSQAHNQTIERSEQLEDNHHQIINNKIGSSVPLRMNFDIEGGIPQSCQLDQDNVDYLQTDRYGGTQMKPYDLQQEESDHFQQNFVNRKKEQVKDNTPCKPRIPVIESRILCGSEEITNQFRGSEALSKIMNRYGTKSPLTIKKRNLPPLDQNVAQKESDKENID